MEFCDVQLYDESKPEQEPHSTDVLAVRFRGDDSVLHPIEEHALAFDDAEGARALLDDYKSHVSINCFDVAETLSAAQHFFCAKCGGGAFMVGGDKMEVIGNKGEYLVGDGNSFRHDEDLKKQYENFRRKYWRWRARAYKKGGK